MLALFAMLMRDVAQHFHDEEAIILARGYPGTTDHARNHRDLIDHAGDLIERFQVGSLGIGELIEFLAKDVVADHMLRADRTFFSHFEKSASAGRTDQQDSPMG